MELNDSTYSAIYQNQRPDIGKEANLCIALI